VPSFIIHSIYVIYVIYVIYILSIYLTKFNKDLANRKYKKQKTITISGGISGNMEKRQVIQSGCRDDRLGRPFLGVRRKRTVEGDRPYG